MAPGDANPYDTRGDIYRYIGRPDKAIESYKKASEMKSGFSDTNLGNMYVLKREYDKARNINQKLASGSNKNDRARARLLLALIPYHQGKLLETLKLAEAGIAADKMERYTGATAHKYLLKALVYLELNELSLALKECETAIEILLESYPGNKLGFKGFHAYILGADSRLERVDEIVGIVEKELNRKDRKVGKRFDWSVLGLCELSRGNHEAAILHFERSIKEKFNFDGYESNFSDYYFLGKANLDSGRLDEAVKSFETALSTYDPNRVLFGFWGAKAHYLLGSAYEKSGWNRKALEKYEEFLDIWKDADPGIKEVKQAKERRMKLMKKR